MSRSSGEHRSIFDRPVRDHWDKVFDDDQDGWMTPTERGHKQAYLSRMASDDSDSWDDDEDSDDWLADDTEDEDRDEWDDEDDDDERDEWDDENEDDEF